MIVATPGRYIPDVAEHIASHWVDPLSPAAEPLYLGRKAMLRTTSISAPGAMQSRSSTKLARLAWCTLLPALFLVSQFMVAQPAAAQGLKLIRDAEIEDLLNIYSRPIFKAANLGSQRIKVRIINEKAFNAFVLDGRNVFMNTGALMEAQTPNEVIGVIAHETGHIVGGHMAGLRLKLSREATANLISKIVGIGAMVAGGAVGKDAGGEALGDVGRSALTLGDTISQRSILSYRRAQEGSADQAGVSLLTATKQSANGMLVTFQRFAEQELFSDRLKDPYVVSHPMAQDRINQLKEISQRSPYFEAKDSSELQLRHDLMRAKLSGFIEAPQMVLNRYPSKDQSLPAQYARAIASFYSGGIGEALPKIDALISARPDYAYFWELKGDLLMRKGDFKAAVEPMRKAMQLSKEQPLIRVELAQALIGSGNNAVLAEAIALLRKSQVEEENSEGYRQLANAYARQGEQGLALLSTARATQLEGKIGEAKKFAKRSQTFFPANTPNWLKADDILNIKTEGE
jgi:predicted Zn-dependent protease